MVFPKSILIKVKDIEFIEKAIQSFVNDFFKESIYVSQETDRSVQRAVIFLPFFCKLGLYAQFLVGQDSGP